MSRLTPTAVAISVVLYLAGCQFEYPWDVGPPEAQDMTNDLTCGARLEGAMEWYVLDGEDYPEVWTEICTIHWELAGDLTSSYDHDACDGCRCVYDVEGTVSSDSCSWFGEGTENAFQLGFMPTANGPGEYQEYAADWPWLVYSSFSPSWDTLEFTYLAREDDTVLPASYDGGEFYLYSYWNWSLSESEDRMKLAAWVGTWD